MAPFAGPGRAQGPADSGFPALYDVAGVAADDVLNIRAAPAAGAPVIGALAHDARAVELLGLDATGRWARLNIAEGQGWAALRHLRPAARLLPGRGRGDKFLLDLGGGTVAAITRADCSDGMSGRGYGLAIDLILTPAEAAGPADPAGPAGAAWAPALLSGCCSVAAGAGSH